MVLVPVAWLGDHVETPKGLTAEQLAQKFEFTVTFSDGGTYPYYIAATAGKVLPVLVLYILPTRSLPANLILPQFAPKRNRTA